MSFAASTIPASKQQFLSSHKRGGRPKIISPKNQQLPNIDNENVGAPKTHKSYLQPKPLSGNDTVRKKKPKSKEKGASTEKDTSARKDPSRPTSKNADNEVETIANNDLWITSKSKYDEMVFLKQRHELRIESLEADLKEVLQYYEMLYKENEILKDKLNMDDQIVAEPYKTVYNDRGVLRTAEFTYRKRINQLQKEMKELEKENHDLKEEIKQLKMKLPNIEKEKQKDAKYNKMFWENRTLKTENHGLIKKIEILSDDIKFYKTQKGPDWENDIISARDVLLHRSESDYGNDQHFAIFEHEAKRMVAELEENVENLTTTNRYLTKKNQQIKLDHNEVVKKNEDLKTKQHKLEKELKLLKYRLGETKSSKFTDMVGKYDHAKILFHFKQES